MCAALRHHPHLQFFLYDFAILRFCDFFLIYLPWFAKKIGVDQSNIFLLLYYLVLYQNDKLVTSLYMQLHFRLGRCKYCCNIRPLSVYKERGNEKGKVATVPPSPLKCNKVTSPTRHFGTALSNRKAETYCYHILCYSAGSDFCLFCLLGFLSLICGKTDLRSLNSSRVQDSGRGIFSLSHRGYLQEERG